MTLIVLDVPQVLAEKYSDAIVTLKSLLKSYDYALGRDQSSVNSTSSSKSSTSASGSSSGGSSQNKKQHTMPYTFAALSYALGVYSEKITKMYRDDFNLLQYSPLLIPQQQQLLSQPDEEDSSNSASVSASSSSSISSTNGNDNTAAQPSRTQERLQQMSAQMNSIAAVIASSNTNNANVVSGMNDINDEFEVTASNQEVNRALYLGVWMSFIWSFDWLLVFTNSSWFGD